MKGGLARTAAQIAEVLHARAQGVLVLLMKWVESGEAHVCARIGTSPARLFLIGPGDGTPLPQLQTRESSESAMTVVAFAIGLPPLSRTGKLITRTGHTERFLAAQRLLVIRRHAGRLAYGGIRFGIVHGRSHVGARMG